MRKWRKNGVVAEKPKPENPCKSRKNRRRMSIYEIRYRIFILSTSIKHSCLHFGQNMGKFFNEGSARIFVRVLHLQKGQCIHPLSSTQNSSVFCISFAPSFLFSVIFFPAIPIKSAQLIDIIFCFLHRHIVNDYFKYTRIKSTGNNV